MGKGGSVRVAPNYRGRGIILCHSRMLVEQVQIDDITVLKGVIRQRHSSYIGIYARIINTLSIKKNKKIKKLKLDRMTL